MTQQFDNEQTSEPDRKRSRGPGKPFPSITFEDALLLPKSILENGYDGEIQRLTLLSEMRISPQSSRTRGLISGSFKYGLTEGSYSAPSLSITDSGRTISVLDPLSRTFQSRAFELAIRQFEPFRNLYEKLENNRLREGLVLHDELRRLGVSEGDCQQAAEIFTKNLRFLGLVEDISGSDFVRSVPHVAEGDSSEDDLGPSRFPANDSTAEPATSEERNGTARAPVSRPELHINIQIHIDSTSSAELVDQVFSSMGRYLYGRKT